jgi:hypothetical protein
VLPLLVGAATTGGCFQEIDSRASSATNAPAPMAGGTHTVDLMTPPIGVTTGDDGQTTDDPCEATTFDATEVLRRNCSGCHGGGPGQNLGQPAFDYVLDVSRLLMAVSATMRDPVTMQPVRFLVPGDPDHSRVYVRMFRREMPPGDIVGLPDNPNRPTISDVSVVRQWIVNCLGAKPDKPDDEGEGKDTSKDAGPAQAQGAPDAAHAAETGAAKEAGGAPEASPTPEPNGSVDGGAATDGGRATDVGGPTGGDGRRRSDAEGGAG